MTIIVHVGNSVEFSKIFPITYSSVITSLKQYDPLVLTTREVDRWLSTSFNNQCEFSHCIQTQVERFWASVSSLWLNLSLRACTDALAASLHAIARKDKAIGILVPRYGYQWLQQDWSHNSLRKLHDFLHINRLYVAHI